MRGVTLIGAIAAVSAASFFARAARAGQEFTGGVSSAGQGVALIARLPSTARVAGLISAVPQSLLSEGQTAEMVILQQSWTFARGETLDAQCEVLTEPQTTAEVFTSRPQHHIDGFVSSAPPAEGAQVKRFPLVAGFDPGRGSLTDTQILLIVHNQPGETAGARVRITVVAL